MRVIKWKKVIIVLIVLAFFALFAGGWTYYTFQFPGNTVGCILMTLQNCVEALLFNPILPIQEIYTNSDFISSIDLLKTTILHLYSAAMVLAPLVDVLIIFSILDSFLHLFVGFTMKERRILIVGYNDDVRKLLEKRCKNGKVYLWTERYLSAEEERELFFRQVSVRMNDFSLGDSPEEYEKQKRKFDRFIKQKGITDVLLLDSADDKNLQYYMALSSCEACKFKTVHFFVLCNDYEVRNILQDYFDSKLQNMMKAARETARNKEERDNIPENFNSHMDLRIFNYDQIQAELIFSELPIIQEETKKETDKNVHLLIIGDDELVNQTILHAMNQAVYSVDNTIIIDVISCDTGYIRDRLNKRFCKRSVQTDGAGLYIIDSNVSDGQLIIRLKDCNVKGSDFIPLLKALCESDGAFSYVALLSTKGIDNLHAFISLKNNANQQLVETDTPLAIRMTFSAEMKEFLSTSKSSKNVYLLGSNREYIGLDQIINIEEEKNIRIYNRKYHEIQVKRIEDKPLKKRGEEYREVLWNQLVYYKRESNRALYHHKAVKEVLEKKKGFKDEMKTFWETQACTIKDKEPNDLKLSRCLIEQDTNSRSIYPNLLTFAKIEHRRFVYFHISEGWGYCNEKNPRKRLHDCLCSWDTIMNNKTYTIIYDLISSPLLMDGDEE